MSWSANPAARLIKLQKHSNCAGNSDQCLGLSDLTEPRKKKPVFSGGQKVSHFLDISQCLKFKPTLFIWIYCFLFCNCSLRLSDSSSCYSVMYSLTHNISNIVRVIVVEFSEFQERTALSTLKCATNLFLESYNIDIDRPVAIINKSIN